MPVLNRKARDRIKAIFFKAISRKLIRVMALAFARTPCSNASDCQKPAKGLCDSHHVLKVFGAIPRCCP
jgi:hypothetical protein